MDVSTGPLTLVHADFNHEYSPNEHDNEKYSYNNLDVLTCSVHLTDKESNIIPEVTFDKKNIIRFIDDATDISAEQKVYISNEVNDPSNSIIVSDLYKRIVNNIKLLPTLVWEKRLADYLDKRPERYTLHRGSRTAPQFLEDTWGEYLDHDVLYQKTLSDYDDQLIPAIYRHWNIRGRGEKDRLPLPLKDRADAILQRAADCGPHTKEEIKRAANATLRRSASDRSR